MKIKKVWAVYFSATGTTKKSVMEIVQVVAERLGTDFDTYDFTLPESRLEGLHFSDEDLVVFGTPVYAGRVPNVLLKYLALTEGNGALGVPVVLFGNRNYDDALIEMRDIMETGGFHTIAAAAFIGEHSFSTVLAKERPDGSDIKILHNFAEEIAALIKGLDHVTGLPPVAVKGTPAPYSGYYQPRDRKGNPVDIRKVMPATSSDCTDCKLCAEVCPMGSIDRENVSVLTGICIKCCACIKKCPVGAKYFKDAAYLYHQKELEEGFARRALPECFINEGC